VGREGGAVSKGKQRQERAPLPDGWLPRLKDLCRTLWLKHEEDKPISLRSRLDFYEFTGLTAGTFRNANKTGMTLASFQKMAGKIGYERYEDLLEDLESEGNKQTLSPPIPPPTALSLVTQKANAQWADYRVYSVDLTRPWALRCRIHTDSPYFRFGFKLLTEDGRIFGDGLINSFDENLVVHIGRSDFKRDRLKIDAGDLFHTAYMNGIGIEDDRLLFKSPATLSVQIELIVDRDYNAMFLVNGEECYRRNVPPTVCRRIAMYAWGDREEFRVDVTDLTLKPTLRVISLKMK
jgi:hypothetical protein